MEDMQCSLEEVMKDVEANMQELDGMFNERKHSPSLDQNMLFDDYEFDPMSL